MKASLHISCWWTSITVCGVIWKKLIKSHHFNTHLGTFSSLMELSYGALGCVFCTETRSNDQYEILKSPVVIMMILCMFSDVLLLPPHRLLAATWGCRRHLCFLPTIDICLLLPRWPLFASSRIVILGRPDYCALIVQECIRDAAVRALCSGCSEALLEPCCCRDRIKIPGLKNTVLRAPSWLRQ